MVPLRLRRLRRKAGSFEAYRSLRRPSLRIPHPNRGFFFSEVVGAWVPRLRGGPLDGPLGRLARGPESAPPGGADGGCALPADRPFADGRDGLGGFPDGRGGRLELLIGSTRGCSSSVDSVL